MKGWKKLSGRARSLLFALVASAGMMLLSLMLGRMNSWAAFLVEGASVFLLLVLAGGLHLPHVEEVKDAPHHEHGYRLHYIGCAEGWDVMCPTCRRCWKLHEDDVFFIRGATYVMWFVIYSVSTLANWSRMLPPALQDVKILWMALSIAVSQVVVHGLAYLLMCRSDLKCRIAGINDGQADDLPPASSDKEACPPAGQ